MSKKHGGLADSPFFAMAEADAQLKPIQATEVFSQASPPLPPRRSTASAHSDHPTDRTAEAVERTNEGTVAAVEQPNGRTDEQIAERRTQRYSFEFYTDQIEAIRKLRARRELQGERLSLSDIVRAAIDRYLQQDGTQ
jgi:hypothetical protein